MVLSFSFSLSFPASPPFFLRYSSSVDKRLILPPPFFSFRFQGLRLSLWLLTQKGEMCPPFLFFPSPFCRYSHVKIVVRRILLSFFFPSSFSFFFCCSAVVTKTLSFFPPLSSQPKPTVCPSLFFPSSPFLLVSLFQHFPFGYRYRRRPFPPSYDGCVGPLPLFFLLSVVDYKEGLSFLPLLFCRRFSLPVSPF